jgi:hypothetical protein
MQRAVDRVIGRGEQQHVAVGRRLGERVGRHHAAGTRLVLDHHRLAEICCQFFREQPRHQIDGAAGRERHHQAHRAVGILLCRRRGGEKRGEQRAAGKAVQAHRFPPW